jgi:drug/metabolite transporter (DMT)-like permease
VSLRSILGISLVCTIWGAGFSFMKVGLQYLPPFLYVGLRFALTAILVVLIARLAGTSLRIPLPARGRLAITTTLFFIQQGAIFWGLTYTTAGRMGVILNTQPIITAILAHWFVAHDRLSCSKLLGLLLAALGVFFIFRESFARTEGLMRIGDLLALLAAFSWGTQNIVTKHLVRDMRPTAITAWQAGLSAPCFLLIGLLVRAGPLPLRPFDLGFALATLYIIVVATVFGFVAWVYLIERNPPSQVTSFCFITPIASLFFGWLLLGEHVSRDIILATALVGVGIFVANYGARPPAEAEVPTIAGGD